jgi:hypothetical protein
MFIRMIQFTIRKDVANLRFGRKHDMCQSVQISPREFNTCVSEHDLNSKSKDNLILHFFTLDWNSRGLILTYLYHGLNLGMQIY